MHHASDFIVDVKEKIRTSFSDAATEYDQFARVQLIGAQRLVNFIEPRIKKVPPGPILEIGAGTGFLTEYLPDVFPDRPLLITDISSNMLDRCHHRLKRQKQLRKDIRFDVLDGEFMQQDERFAAILSGFTVQWFTDPVLSMKRMLHHITDGGYLFVSFLADGSFLEWKKISEELSLPFTGNALPDAHSVSDELTRAGYKVRVKTARVEMFFPNPLMFFYSLKRTGASVTLDGDAYPPKDLRRLLTHWGTKSSDGIRVTHHVCYLSAKVV